MRASNKANKSKACQEMADKYPSVAGSSLEDANTIQAVAATPGRGAPRRGPGHRRFATASLLHKSLIASDHDSNSASLNSFKKQLKLNCLNVFSIESNFFVSAIKSHYMIVYFELSAW